MAASSVTGTGPGESFGKQKPELHSGCGCCSKPSSSTPTVRRKVGCVTRYGASTGSVRYSSGFGPAKVGSCI